MIQRKPGDYVINAELTDEQRERFVADCVAAGAVLRKDAYDGEVMIMTKPLGLYVGSARLREDRSNTNVTHEYKETTMTAQPELMRQIADAMERNPEGWWREFEFWGEASRDWLPCSSAGEILSFTWGRCVRPKPRTYTLHIEDMPEPLRKEPGEDKRYWYASPKSGKVGCHVWLNDKVDRACFNNGLCYPDEQTAREALEKLTKAMGGGE